MKKLTVIVASLLVTGGLSAQNFEDVLRTSEIFPRGDARFMSMSGAMGALGGNTSAISINPAGSAIARNGVLEFTPAFTYIKSENHFQGNYNRRFETAFRLPNFALMVARNTPNAGVLSGISYGFSMNNQNIFDASMRYETKSATSSFTDEALWQADNNQGTELPAFSELFWQSYLLNKDEYGFFTDFTEFYPPQYGHQQTTVINRSGGKNECLFNLGLDFSQFVYIGADLSIQSINYNNTFMLEERDIHQQFDFLDKFTYGEKLAVSGNGFMGKFGAIVRPIEYIRLGIAYHTPTTFFLSEEFTQHINANFDQNVNPNPEGNNILNGAANTSNVYDYNITTPGRTLASVGFVFKNIAMLGIDYESVNYKNAYIEAHYHDSALSDANDAVADNLTRADNLKIGAELAYGMYSLRLGTAFYGNPYENRKNDNTFYRTDISAGLGIRTEGGFYCDFAWVKSAQTQYNYLYTDYVGNNIEGKTKLRKTDFAVTLGFKF